MPTDTDTALVDALMRGAEEGSDRAGAQILAQGLSEAALTPVVVHDVEKGTAVVDWLAVEQLKGSWSDRERQLARVALAARGGLFSGMEPSDRTLVSVALQSLLS